ncbi:protein Star-like [Amphibalanus amphitrite]|uniref:protein Star-like n=1 Tax=Amphibalanus amphitrite TaxID=1232801 RepID=UPI001C92AAEA|nr:protein Star-like [Amphibalanus amphitrite]
MTEDKNWTGVLVEAEDTNYQRLLAKHRRARLLNACLAPTPYPQQLAFEHIPGTLISYVFPGFTREDLDDKMRLKQCYPLYSILAAAGLTSLDFLSLDIEGIDHLVLKSLPWKKVDIKMVMVEYVTPGTVFPNGSFNPEFEKPIKDIMFANDYVLAKQLPTDMIFVKNGSVFDRS